MATARKSLQGELRWELECEPLIKSGGVRQLPSVRELPGPLATGPENPPDPDPAACGKYPPGEGSPSVVVNVIKLFSPSSQIARRQCKLECLSLASSPESSQVLAF
jgi:hypothetical protein